MIKYEHVLLYLIKPPNLEGKKKSNLQLWKSKSNLTNRTM